jgi:hypothetical protein
VKVSFGVGPLLSKALDRLKASVMSSPVLAHPDDDKPLFVVIDASNIAVGASLEQNDCDGNRRPVAFLIT